MQLVPGIRSIGQKEGGHVHAFLVDQPAGLTLIDTMYDHDGGRIISEIETMGLRITDLKHILITHAHASHIKGAARLKALSGAKVYIHEAEEKILRGKEKAKGVTLWPRRPLSVYALQLGLYFGAGKHNPCDPDKFLREGDSVGELQVIEVPGHTPGCLAFWWPQRKALFAGDIVSTWPRLELGWKGLTLDNRQNRESVNKVADMINAEALCVGHGEPIAASAWVKMRGLLDGD